jgi:triacylglycerol lipase
VDPVPGDGAGVVLGPPPRALFAAETPRLLVTLARLPGAWRRLKRLPAGDGRPVLVLPGLGNSDRSTVVLRRLLAALDYRVEGWGLGRNLGARVTGRDGAQLLARLEAMAEATGAPVTLIGVSLGGLMARWVAQRAPERVREVITISSPFAGPARATNVWRAFEWLTGERVDDEAVLTRMAELRRPLPVPATAIWSASDGFVNGRACRAPDDPTCRNVEIRSGHVGVQMNPQTLAAVAEALARSAED